MNGRTSYLMKEKMITIINYNTTSDRVSSATEDFEGDIFLISENVKRKKCCEALRTAFCLSDAQICALLNRCKCTKTRLSEVCANDYKCANTVGPIIQAKEKIRSFRKKFWPFDDKKQKGCVIERRLVLIRDLETLYVERAGVKLIDYRITGHEVCKDFYFEASYVSQRMFDDAVAYVLGQRTSDDMVRFFSKGSNENGILPIPKRLIRHCSDNVAQQVVKFLNHYFTYSVEWSPHGKPFNV